MHKNESKKTSEYKRLKDYIALLEEAIKWESEAAEAERRMILCRQEAESIRRLAAVAKNSLSNFLDSGAK
jgi:hypothetical protein